VLSQCSWLAIGGVLEKSRGRARFAIADQLDAAGVRRPTAGERWWPSAIGPVVNRASWGLSTGHIHIPTNENQADPAEQGQRLAGP
jgi:hypothetical protein